MKTLQSQPVQTAVDLSVNRVHIQQQPDFTSAAVEMSSESPPMEAGRIELGSSDERVIAIERESGESEEKCISQSGEQQQQEEVVGGERHDSAGKDKVTDDQPAMVVAREEEIREEIKVRNKMSSSFTHNLVAERSTGTQL